MIKLPLEASDEQILKGVDEWIVAMSQENYHLAYELTHHPDSRGWDIGPEMLKTLVRYYGSPEPIEVDQVYRITVEFKPCVTGDGCTRALRREVNRYKNLPKESPPWGPTFDEVQAQRAPDGGVGYVWCDLAMNGERSDLTALFDLVEFEGDLVLILDQLRVM